MKSKYDGTRLWFGMTREQFDSDEELEFWCWLKEGESAGIIGDIRFHPYYFTLSDRATIKFNKHLMTKIKTVDKFILHPHSYTPDYYFTIKHPSLSKLNYLVENSIKSGKFMVVDVKGGFSKFGDSKQFSINQKWTFDKFGVYVQKIVPEKLFKVSWVPEVCRLSPKQLKPVKKYVGVKTINEFMEGI